jgi:hypothetical protein
MWVENEQKKRLIPGEWAYDPYQERRTYLVRQGYDKKAWSSCTNDQCLTHKE